MSLNEVAGGKRQPLFNISIVFSIVTAHASSEYVSGYDLGFASGVAIYLAVLIATMLISRMLTTDDEKRARRRDIENRVQRLPRTRFS